MIKLNRFRNNLLIPFLLIVLLCFLIAHGGYAELVLQAMRVWAIGIVPSLFPYFFFATVFSLYTEKNEYSVNRNSSSLYYEKRLTAHAFVISSICGYPIGTKTVCDLKTNNLLTRKHVDFALVLCSCASPMFLIYGIGKMTFNSLKFGTLLYFSCLFSAIINGVFYLLLFMRKPSLAVKKQCDLRNKPNTNVLNNSLNSSILAMLNLGANMVLSLVTYGFLNDSGLLFLPEKLLSLLLKNDLCAKGLCLGLFDTAFGMKLLATEKTEKLTFAVCGFLCGLGGLGNLTQSILLLKKAKIKTARFVFFKFLQAVICFVLCWIIGFFFF